MSTLKVNDIEEATSGGSKIFFIRAWVNWRSQSTAGIVAERGVSSGTDTGVGAWQTNFDTVFANANYASAGSNGENASTTNNAAISFNTGGGGQGNTTSYRRCSAENVDSGYTDYPNNTVIFCGDQ